MADTRDLQRKLEDRKRRIEKVANDCSRSDDEVRREIGRLFPETTPAGVTAIIAKRPC